MSYLMMMMMMIPISLFDGVKTQMLFLYIRGLPETEQ